MTWLHIFTQRSTCVATKTRVSTVIIIKPLKTPCALRNILTWQKCSLCLLCIAGYSPQLLITETSSWFNLIPAETCESQASLNTQWDTSAASDYEYIIHQKNLTLCRPGGILSYEIWPDSDPVAQRCCAERHTTQPDIGFWKPHNRFEWKI